MKNIISLLVLFFVPIAFGWWLFLPLFLLYLYLAHARIEVLVVAVALDRVYYFGSGFWSFRLSIICLICLLIAFFVEGRLRWPRFF